MCSSDLEGAVCFVDWMRSCLFYSSASSTLLPATLTGMLPIGGMLYKAGNLSATNFILLIILSFGIIAPLMNASAHGEDIGKIGTIVAEVVSILEQENMKTSLLARLRLHLIQATRFKIDSNKKARIVRAFLLEQVNWMKNE